MMGNRGIRQLANGNTIPVIGLGTWKSEGEEAYQAVYSAIKLGYEHIDTASVYGNEVEVGRAIHDSGKERSELFVTSKLWNDAVTYQGAIDAFENSLSRLKMDYLDLYLIHWPNPVAVRENWQERNAEVWRAMEDLYKAGKVRAIGVSNFMPHHLRSLLESAKIKPMVNQIKLAPGIYQEEIVKLCQKEGILIEAYSPFGHGELFKQEDLLDLSKKKAATPAQIALSWSLQHGFIPLPKSVHSERLKSNLIKEVISLTDEEMNFLDHLPDMGDAPNPDEKNY